MKELLHLWKKRDYHSIFCALKQANYDYTIDNLERDFGRIPSIEKFCYLIYLLSNDFSVKNVILVCDFLMYTDTFFYDIHPVVHMITLRALEMHPTESALLEWIVSNYENHPESPYKEVEIISLKERLISRGG